MTFMLQAHRERVGRNVKSARLRSGFSLDNLAAAVGSSRQHLIRIEKGKHLPRPAMLASIAEATNTTVAALEAGGDDEEEPDPVAIMQVLFDRAVGVAVEKRLALREARDARDRIASARR